MPTNGSNISVPEANGYITEFINNYFNTGKVPVKSLIMSADLLRDYLNNDSIENVKFMLGERTVDEDGTSKKTLTLVVAGYDSNGDYVLTSDGKVPDHLVPCPNMCPTVGNAANDLIS